MLQAATYGDEEIELAIQHFCTPQSSIECEPPLDANELRTEFQTFRPFVVRNFGNVDFDTFAKEFLRDYSDMYPQIAALMNIMLVLPVSSVPCERGFSSANRIKTKLRNRLKVSTIDTLLRISIKGPPIDQFDFSKSLDYYRKTKQHRIFNYN